MAALEKWSCDGDGLTQSQLSTAVLLAWLWEYRLWLCKTAGKAGKGYSSLPCIQTRGCKSAFDALVSRHGVHGGLEGAFYSSPDKLSFHRGCWSSPVPVPAGWSAFMSIPCVLHRTLSLQWKQALCWSSEYCECRDEERNCCLSHFMILSLYYPLLGPITCQMHL